MIMGRDAVEQLTRTLRVSARMRRSIERELRAHLEDSRRELELSGLTPPDAARESLSRLGNPDEIVTQFDTVYRPKRRTQIGLALALASGMALGVLGIGGSLASATSAHHKPAQHSHVRHG
ncbi:MAG TPA: hypothetical protein DEV93_08510 [Chloroflexi bacterium]|nr:hypothetical protein [Chloroflexota bacterium]